MKSIRVFQNSDVEKVRQRAIVCLEKNLIYNSNKSVLLLLSGGSALSLLFPNLKGLNNRVTIGVLDERYSSDPKINNFSQLSATPFFATAKENGCVFINTSIKDGETMQNLELRFEKELKLWRDKNPEGKIIITQGMGLDGHTAGIMPYPEDNNLFQKQFDDKNKWVASYDAGNKNQYSQRVTTTLPFLRAVDVSIMFVSGKEKADILNKILSKNILHNIFPASIIKVMKTVLLFTDCIINDIKLPRLEFVG